MSAFLILLGCGEVHAPFQFLREWFCWGGGGLGSLVGLLESGILTENVYGCVSRSSRITTPGQRNPVSNSKERQAYEVRLALLLECMVPTLQGIIVGGVLNNMSVSIIHTSQRPNQRYLCKNKTRRQTMKKKIKQGSERTPGSSAAECET